VTDCAFGSIATPGSSGFEFETPTTVVVVRCGCEGLAKNVAAAVYRLIRRANKSLYCKSPAKRQTTSNTNGKHWDLILLVSVSSVVDYNSNLKWS